jgi:hypothetical protein
VLGALVRCANTLEVEVLPVSALFAHHAHTHHHTPHTHTARASVNSSLSGLTWFASDSTGERQLVVIVVTICVDGVASGRTRRVDGE